MKDPFWDTVLENGETLLWAGRPRASLLNFRLIWPFGVAVCGMVWLPFNTAVTGDAWLDAVILFAVGVVIAFMVLRGVEIWTRLRQTRYALTNRRAIFFRIGKQTKVRAVPLAAFRPARIMPGFPPSVLFLTAPQSPADAAPVAGFEYLPDHTVLIDHLSRLESRRIPQ